jgi:phosphohistidine swiveling domain-containing protein
MPLIGKSAIDSMHLGVPVFVGVEFTSMKVNERRLLRQDQTLA